MRGETVWQRGRLADVEAGREATPDTSSGSRSITKTFTAVAIMQLRDAGLASSSARPSPSTCPSSRTAA